jgi:hypothetical protein
MGFELEWFFLQLLSDQNNWSLGNRPLRLLELLDFEPPQGFERNACPERTKRVEGQRLNDWNDWNGLILTMNEAKRR